MKFIILLISVFFSSHASAYRLDGEFYFYAGKGVSIVNPYYEESDGTRFPINVKYFNNGDPSIPELTHLCSMYTNAPADQILADGGIGKKEGMVYKINQGFSPLPLPNLHFVSVDILTCFSNQYQSVPLGGKTTYSTDGFMTIESPTVEHNGKVYPIAPCKGCMEDFCRLLGYRSFEAASFSVNRGGQSIEVVNFYVKMKKDSSFIKPEVKTSGNSPFLVLDSFTCKP